MAAPTNNITRKGLFKKSFFQQPTMIEKQNYFKGPACNSAHGCEMKQSKRLPNFCINTEIGTG